MADFDIRLIDPASASEAEGGGESARLESARERQRLSHSYLIFHVRVEQARPGEHSGKVLDFSYLPRSGRNFVIRIAHTPASFRTGTCCGE